MQNSSDYDENLGSIICTWLFPLFKFQANISSHGEILSAIHGAGSAHRFEICPSRGSAIKITLSLAFQ